MGRKRVRDGNGRQGMVGAAPGHNNGSMCGRHSICPVHRLRQLGSAVLGLAIVLTATISPLRAPRVSATAPPPSARPSTPPPPPLSNALPEDFSTFHHAKRDAAGHVKAEFYLLPQFRRGTSGWVPIDATVSPRSNDADHPFSAEGAIRPIRFGRDASHLVQLELDGGEVTMSAPSLSVGSPRPSAAGVTYHNVATDTDLSYHVDAGMVKEEILLRSAQAPRQFTFHIGDPNHQLGALRLQADGSFLFDGRVDDAAVRIPPPTAYQQPQAGLRGASPANRGSAHMTTTAAGDGTDVTVKVDDAWLAGKQFPIVLDPPVTFSEANGTLLDAYALYSPNTCLASCGMVTQTWLPAGNGLADDLHSLAEPYRSYYYFNLGSIPLGSTVSSAAFAQYLGGCGFPEPGVTTNPCATHDFQVDLHHMTGPWSPGLSTWTDLVRATSPSVDWSVIQPAFTCGPCGWDLWNMTSLTRQWVAGTLPNYGFDAQINPEGYGRGYLLWAYHEADTLPRPYLAVSYDPPPNSAYWPNPCDACRGVDSTKHPINDDTGDLWHTFDDMSIPGRGIPFHFSHTYNSLGATQTTHMGYGWSSSYDMTQTTDSNGLVTVHQENGATVTFTPVGGGYIASSDNFATLVKNADGTLTFTRKDKTQYVFAASGPVIKEIDRNGYVTTIALYNNGPLSVTDPAGRTVTFSIDSSGRIQGLTDPAGRTVGFGYDGNGDLTAITDVRGKTTTITYYPGHLLQTMTDPNGGIITNYYKTSGQAYAQYDAMNRLTELSYQPGITAILDPDGVTHTVEHYTNHSLVKRTRDVATWTYTRDPATQAVATVTDPNGGVTTNTWDASGNRRSTTDPIQRTTTYTYNAFNEVATETDPLNVTTTNIYDGSGNLRSTSRPLTSTGQTATTTYTYGDPAHPGDVTAMTDANRKVWQYTYDQYGNRGGVVDPLGNATTYGYDGIGRMTASVSPRGNVPGGNPAAYVTTYGFDNAFHPTSVTDPLRHSTTYGYDNVGNRTSVTDANGHQTITTYDLDNEVARVTRADGTSLQTGYDKDGNVASQTDGLGRTTTYTHDRQNHLATMTDPLSRTTTYHEDALGNLGEIDYPTGQVTHQAFDLANQRYQITYGSATTHDVGFSYDNDGQQTGMDDGIGHTTWVYDSLHRRTQSTTPTGQVLYGYDLKGQLTSITYPNSRTAIRGYDDAGRLSSVSDWLGHTTSFGHDPDANLTTEAYPNTTQATLGYDAADRLLSMAHSRGATGLASFGYGRDSVGQLTSTTVSGISQPNESYTYSPIDQLKGVNTSSYGYDAGDNITQLASGLTGSYDAANELTSLTGSTRTGYGYDARGERVGTAGPAAAGAHGYTYDQAGRMIQASQLNGTLAAGGNHSLAAATDGSVWTWGSDEAGELGNGTVTNGSSVAAHLTTPGQVVAVSAGTSHDLALRVDGTVWGWGANHVNQLGNSQFVGLAGTPIPVTGLSGVTAIASSGDHNLALKSDGTVWTWGYNNDGELGHGSSGLLASTALGPVPGLPRIVAIGAGNFHSMAVAADGSVWAWGHNSEGELGNGTTVSSAVPVKVGGGLT